jgi:hypothetical protein
VPRPGVLVIEGETSNPTRLNYALSNDDRTLTLTLREDTGATYCEPLVAYPWPVWPDSFAQPKPTRWRRLGATHFTLHP